MRIILFTLIPIVIILAIVVGCSGKFEPDPIDPRIPRYSEEGLNAAGALVNGGIWRAEKGVSFPKGPSQVLQLARDSAQTQLRIDGRITDDDTTAFLAVTFYLNNAAGNLDRINDLRGRTFSLDGTHYADLTDDEYPLEDLPRCRSRSGQLYVKYLARINTATDTDYVLSGTFSFTTDEDSCTKYEVTFGRFDYRISGN